MEEKVYEELQTEFSLIANVPDKTDEKLVRSLDESHLYPGQQIGMSELIKKMKEYRHVLEHNSISLVQYINAIKFVIYFQYLGMGVAESYRATFPDKVIKTQKSLEAKYNRPILITSELLTQTISAKATIFKNSKAVKAVLGIIQAETHLVFAQERMEALNQLYKVGMGKGLDEEELKKYSGKTRVDSLNIFLTQTKLPEPSTKVDVNIDNRTQVIENNHYNELYDGMEALVNQQKKALLENVLTVEQLGAFDTGSITGQKENN
jgi:hypothetical protein